MNQAAADASTGPRTQEGKAASSKNATKHGAFAAIAFIPAGMQADFDRLYERYRVAFLPPNATPGQLIIFENLVKDAWNEYRIEILIATINGEQPNDPMNKWDFDKLYRTLTRVKSSYRANLKLLQAIQTAQLLVELLPAAILEGKIVPGLVNFQQLITLTKRTAKVLAQTTEIGEMIGV
jgi:hypothetical protein